MSAEIADWLAPVLKRKVRAFHAQTAGEILKAYESLKKPERKTRLVEGAKKEGRLVVYGTLGVDAARPMAGKVSPSSPVYFDWPLSLGLNRHL